ncbi:PREDICTED: F-box protein At5g03100-like [Lupinus angustifolius]|uniref:F-box protein At5g03100-like n=1 Tax=Lupinus angustifolius TaxID=3871 RepID=UPI00092E706E|nr:PREDICTED: F-box protein At5g03100-like [Lupinus angustifolius]
MANTTTPSISIETMDYLSLLPQELIHAHILPKLFTKEAARTTILSKRWRSLWTSLPYLEFYQFHFHHTISFRNFVDHTIRDHARTETDILRFKLFITHDIQVSDIDNWVRLVMSRNVREFHLHNLGREPYTWPSRNVCMANTITLLELYNCEVRCNNNNIRLPHLQTLSFEKVLIDHRSIEFFLIGCPSMNDLKVWNCYELKYLIIANHHQLKRVCIGNCIWLEKLVIFQVPCLQSLILYLTQSFVTLSQMSFILDSGAYENIKELHLCNYSNEEKAFQDLLYALTNLECLILKSVRQCSQNIEISSKNLKKLVLEHCDFFMVSITAPNLTSLKYENNHMLLYPMDTFNVKDYIFSNCCNYSIGPDEKSLKFGPVKQFLMNSSNDLMEGTKMIIDLKWCNYIVVLEDWESISELPYEVIDGLFPKAMCISNMSFSQMAEWFLNHSLCFSQKLLIISSSDSKFYKVLKEKRPDCYSESSSFTMSREAFERNIGLSLVSMNNISGENDHKIAFFDALFEVGFNTKQAIVLESL